MSSILEACAGRPERQVAEGETLLQSGEVTGCLFILIDGSVEVLKDGVRVAKTSEPGAIFGDLSALLEIPHTATVQAARPSRFFVIDDPRRFLNETPGVCLHLCELLARRLDAMNRYLVDVKQQFAGHDHMGMLDSLLDTLMHRHPRQRVRPPDSTIAGPE
ncbi:MAG: cyclic nucleotide-binding domain-containing protein [Terrimicrobiaceae bacterium]|nr:cyclic nucleotide-binding domain-containing protein [Terrimicrobiaceae bacterium]